MNLRSRLAVCESEGILLEESKSRGRSYVKLFKPWVGVKQSAQIDDYAFKKKGIAWIP
jgi:hypothetical protein